jgi:hypothetical protein
MIYDSLFAKYHRGDVVDAVRAMKDHQTMWLLAVVVAACHGNFPARDGGHGDGDTDGDIDADAEIGADADADSDGDVGSDADVEPDSDPCLPRAGTSCNEGDLWWFDSCGNVEEIAEDCTADGAVCRDGACCHQHQRTTCRDGDAWWVDSCGNLEEIREACDDGLACTTDACSEAEGACGHVPDCRDEECVASVEECQCRPDRVSLFCDARGAGSLAPGPGATDVMETYGSGCALEESMLLDGNEMTYRFSHRLRSPQLVRVLLASVCGDELWAVVLDGGFSPCDPSRCIRGQTRAGPV